MALRNIVEIDEEKCNGCGDCVPSCAEGAIQIIDGKAKLLAEHLCDGLGACLGECPQDAIRIIQRDADDYDEAAVEQHLAQQQAATQAPAGGCPGSRAMAFGARPAAAPASDQAAPSQLGNWPVQLHLASPHAPYFQGADLLLVADCVPFAYADFHRRFLRQQPVVIGCPKLDDAQAYVQKLTSILQSAHPRSLSVLHMEVPCCTGLARIAQLAILQADIDLEVRHVIVGLQGDIKSDQTTGNQEGAGQAG